MPISEDTRAIIASSLTAAHCSRAGTQADGSAAETQSAILEIYQMYARSLGIGVAVGSSRPSTIDDPVN